MKYLKVYDNFRTNEELFGGLFGKKEESPSAEQGKSDQVNSIKQKVSQVFPGVSDKLETESLYKLQMILNNLFFEGGASLEFFSTLNKVLEDTKGIKFNETSEDTMNRLKDKSNLLDNLQNLFKIIETGEFTDKAGKKYMFPALKGENALQQVGKFVNSDQKMINASSVLSKLASLKKESNKEMYNIIDSLKTYLK